MKIQQFCIEYGAEPRTIDQVLRQWYAQELEVLVRTLRDQHDQLVGSAVIAGDALHGDGMLDQIPKELKDAFVTLMRERADTYQEMHEILLRTIQADDGTFLSFDDDRVLGLINKLKGQIGENLFQEHVGHGAQLATSVVQEGWDVCVPRSEGMEYIQVKLYGDAHGVIRHMLDIQQKILAGAIKGVDHETPVDHIYFAVPQDIEGEVRRLAENYAGLSEMVYGQSVPIDAQSAADIVKEGMSNVGPEELSHFFHELLGGALTVVALHSAVNAFFWYKGLKDLTAALADTGKSSAISVVGLGAAFSTEVLSHSHPLALVVGVCTRVTLGRVARSRWRFGDFLEKSIGQSVSNIHAIRGMFPVPQAASI